MGRTVKAATPIPRTTLTGAAFEQLVSHVVNGNWKPGDQIPPERHLCQQLGIARTSLREALKAMELVGMLNSRVGDGTFVCPRSEFLSRPLLWAFTGSNDNELREIIEARMIIEESLSGIAAERGSDTEIAAIGEAVQRMRDSIAREESILEADMAFHLAVAAATHNQLLESASQLLRNLMRQGIHYKLQIPGVSHSILKGHAAIYKAISRRSSTAARKAMRHHLEETMILVTQGMRRRGKAAKT